MGWIEKTFVVSPAVDLHCVEELLDLKSKATKIIRGCDEEHHSLVTEFQAVVLKFKTMIMKQQQKSISCLASFVSNWQKLTRSSTVLVETP